MVFGDLDETVGSGVGEEVDPIFLVEVSSYKVGDEIVVYKVRAVGFEMVLVGLVYRVETLVPVPPVPFCVALLFAYGFSAKDRVHASVDEDPVFGVVVPRWTFMPIAQIYVGLYSGIPNNALNA